MISAWNSGGKRRLSRRALICAAQSEALSRPQNGSTWHDNANTTCSFICHQDGRQVGATIDTPAPQNTTRPLSPWLERRWDMGPPVECASEYIRLDPRDQR